jgi:MFS transporter, DHA1 family, multidrug resistance protein
MNVNIKLITFIANYFQSMKSQPINKRLVIWILGALATVTPFAIDLYLPAFADIAEEFGTTTATVSLSVTSYFIGMAIGQMLYGPLLDRYGRKPPLYAGLLLFVVASIACVQSTSINTMIVFRFLQALGGSVAWVAALAMVRDFFPVEESARIFSLLILTIGVSPLLAPTIGGFIVVNLGWHAVFFTLAAIVILILLLVFFFLPEGQKPDTTISLKAGPMLNTFYSILKVPQFYTYTFSGAFAFATLFIYVAGSPVIFIDMFKVSPQVYGGIFALLSVGFIGGSQVNIFLNKKVSSQKIFSVALICQVIGSVIFLIGVLNHWLDIYSTIAMFFICLTCLGLINPNANALALAPFSKNVGSASALLACSQIGIAGLASSGVAAFASKDTLPVVALMAITCSISIVILLLGKRHIKTVEVGESSPSSLAH